LTAVVPAGKLEPNQITPTTKAHPVKAGAAKLRVLALLRDVLASATKDPTTAELPD